MIVCGFVGCSWMTVWCCWLQLDERSLIVIFMSLPSKKEYPDYYQVISEPIDMSIIEHKIKQDKVRN